jgi:hypothetical protein
MAASIGQEEMEEVHMNWRAGLSLSDRTRLRRAAIVVAAVQALALTGGVLSSLRCLTPNAGQSAV